MPCRAVPYRARSSAVGIKQLMRQILDLPDAESAVEGIERYRLLYCFVLKGH